MNSEETEKVWLHIWIAVQEVIDLLEKISSEEYEGMFLPLKQQKETDKGIHPDHYVCDVCHLFQDILFRVC